MNTNSLAIFFFVLSYLAITLSVNVCELLFLPFPFISVDNASYRKVKLLQKISQISNAKRNTSSYMSTIVQDNTSLMQYTTFKNDKEYNAFNRYLQQRKSVTIFLAFFVRWTESEYPTGCVKIIFLNNLYTRRESFNNIIKQFIFTKKLL